MVDETAWSLIIDKRAWLRFAHGRLASQGQLWSWQHCTFGPICTISVQIVSCMQGHTQRSATAHGQSWWAWNVMKPARVARNEYALRVCHCSLLSLHVLGLICLLVLSTPQPHCREPSSPVVVINDRSRIASSTHIVLLSPEVALGQGSMSAWLAQKKHNNRFIESHPGLKG